MADTMTKREKRKFWEACGFTLQSVDENRLGTWVYPDGKCEYSLPDFTLDNLFKYAMPKLRELNNDIRVAFSFGEGRIIACGLSEWSKETSRKKNFKWISLALVTNETATLALRDAIWQVLKEKK